MKRIALILALAGLMILCHPMAAHSVNVPIVVDPNTPAPLVGAEIVVSAVPFGAQTSFIELYNQTDRAVGLDDYSVILVFGTGDTAEEALVSLPDGYLLAESYLAVAQNGVDGEFDGFYDLPEIDPTKELSEVYLSHPGSGEVLQLMNFKPTATKYTWLKRRSGSAGHGAAQDSFTQKESSDTLSGFGLFQRPEDSPVQIVEVLARSSSCAPYDASLVCGDYIKLHNPTSEVVDLADFVLRSDSGSSQIGNSFVLKFEMLPNSYLTIYQRDDRTKLNLNDSGGYVWLEDRGGIAVYQSTLINYPSAGTSQVGRSWALDSGDTWRWTSTPRPDAANLITVPVATTSPQSDDTLASCGEGRYRHPETNRCRSIESQSPSLQPCAAGQERNPATNRCRSVVAASATLEPCAPGQVRNPETNRCRAIASADSELKPCALGQERNPLTNRCRSVVASAASLAPCKPGQERNPATNRCRSINSSQSTLKPCSPGQERNPTTNRCRKVASSDVLAQAARQSDESEAGADQQPVAWYGLVGAVVAVAAGYGLWEWRSEIATGAGRLRGLLIKK